MKFCVYGAGIMGRNHIRVLLSLGHVVFAVDPNEENRALNMQLNPSTLGSFNKFDGKDINPSYNFDAYVVATPTTTHFKIVKDILENDPGKPILIEKPVCTTVKEALELKKLAGDTLIAVGHIEQHNPIVLYTREQIQNKVKLINSYRLGHNTRITDVGVVADLAIHDVDVLASIVGSKVESVSAQMMINPETGHESFGKLLLNFENKVVGSVEVSWVHPKKIRKIEAVTEDAFITADYLTQTFVKSNTTELNGLEMETTEQVLKRVESLKLQYLDFTNAIENNKKPLVDLNQAIEALKVIEAAYQSAKTGKCIKIS